MPVAFSPPVVSISPSTEPGPEDVDVTSPADDIADDSAFRIDYAPLFAGSLAMRALLRDIQQVADTNATILVQGESGVGKEVVAKTIHFASNRRRRPFVRVNCASLPSELLESELFGHEKGAFTGAYRRKPGKFEIAERGTIV